MIKAVFLDFDGTLAATQIATLAVYNELAEKHSLRPFTIEDIPMLRTLHWKDLISQCNVPVRSIPRLLKEGQKIIKGHMAYQSLCQDSIPDVLAQLRDEMPVIGIVSSNSKKNISIFLSAHNINMMDFVMTSPLFSKASKIAKALNKYSLSSDEALYVGDELRDIYAAREAGTKVAAATWGFNAEELLVGANPDFLIGNFTELLQIVGIT
jgi:phosphoglycolate phosphatase-like HAD superfamily hydrolase